MLKIRWLGHSAFSIETRGKVILLDPALTINPKAAVRAEDIRRVNYILVSHGHFDHLGDTVSIAKRTGAKVIAMAELTAYLQKRGVKKAVMMNYCSPMDFDGVKIGLVPAAHSGGIGLEQGKAMYSGSAAGFIIRCEKKTVYFAGDTGLCADLKMIGEVYRPDIAMLPISGSFTMDPEEAAIAVGWLKPKFAIPMHYDSLDILPDVDPEDFRKAVRKRRARTRCIIMKPGDVSEF